MQIEPRVIGNQTGRTCREADEYRRCDEVGQHAKAEDRDQQLDNTDHQGRRKNKLDVVWAARTRQRREHGEQREGIGIGRARHHMAARTHEGGHHAGQQGRIDAVLRRQARQARECDALGQHEQGPEQAGEQVRTQGLQREIAPPGVSGGNQHARREMAHREGPAPPPYGPSRRIALD